LLHCSADELRDGTVGSGMGDFPSGNLIWIIHNPNESGYR